MLALVMVTSVSSSDGDKSVLALVMETRMC